MNSYSSRIQILLSKLNDLCIIEAGKGSKKIVELLNSQTALTAFQEGLNSNIRIVVKSANCKMLQAAITKACEDRHKTVDLGKTF